MFEWLASPEAWMALATLMALEIILGIDNIIFISVLVGRLPESQRDRARRVGLMLAMGTRLLLLFGFAWIMSLVEPLFSLFGNEVSTRDIILLLGGLFLIGKSTYEIHSSFEQAEAVSVKPVVATNMAAVLVQIAILDSVFSLDSIITAVSLVDDLSIIMVAIIASITIMMVAVRPIGEFVDAHPTIKMLALAFLILIGITLIAESFDMLISKKYIYFAIVFAFLVELLNIKARTKARKVVSNIKLVRKSRRRAQC